ncbi:MAG: hypothetical protein A2Y24_02925 [Clostridiales bacterium GWE2_32_10]|nr:MAG: hypothetical protein A2Y24_02925 [Clostridiales bacterium GWE2_32_10]HBY19550.1 hypothetical protein [Clostridiales bacterium]
MHDLIYDIIIGFIFMIIIYTMISLFSSNIGLIGVSTVEKTDQVKQIDNNKSSVSESSYTAADLLAYINDEADSSLIIIILSPSQIYNISDAGEKNYIIGYLKVNLDTKYTYDKVSFTFTKT